MSAERQSRRRLGDTCGGALVCAPTGGGGGGGGAGGGAGDGSGGGGGNRGASRNNTVGRPAGDTASWATGGGNAAMPDPQNFAFPVGGFSASHVYDDNAEYTIDIAPSDSDGDDWRNRPSGGLAPGNHTLSLEVRHMDCPPNTMARITTDCDATRSPARQTARITSGFFVECVIYRSA